MNGLPTLAGGNARNNICAVFQHLLDRLSKKPVIIFCADGGVEIEETAKTNPERIVKVEIDPA
ncbi:hypothetical protein LJC42_04525, partial [Eubacteriales bacterium OttesenSCG-928-K08]|nr:hypothetical protein [Eubacteriales bacterium OttesenSCG-928-K08]